MMVQEDGARFERAIAESLGFQKVFFGMTENLEFLLGHFPPFEGKRVLSVAGSGDAPISFLQRGASVMGVDVTDAAIYWTAVKIACAEQLDSEDYCTVLNALNPNQKRGYDFERAQRCIFDVELPGGPVDVKTFFSSEDSLREWRERFFITTRYYGPELSPHSFVHPGPLSEGRLTLVRGDLFDQLEPLEFDHIHLSNILDYIFIRGSNIKYFADGVPDYSEMPNFTACPEREERMVRLRRLTESLREGGTASSFTAAYFTPYTEMFITCGVEAGFGVECYEFPSPYHLQRGLKDLFINFKKQQYTYFFRYIK